MFHEPPQATCDVCGQWCRPGYKLCFLCHRTSQGLKDCKRETIPEIGGKTCPACKSEVHNSKFSKIDQITTGNPKHHGIQARYYCSQDCMDRPLDYPPAPISGGDIELWSNP